MQILFPQSKPMCELTFFLPDVFHRRALTIKSCYMKPLISRNIFGDVMWFRKKKKRERPINEEVVISFLLEGMISTGEMQPVYLDYIKTESDAENLKDAPLVLLWNEFVVGDDLHYDMSVNSDIVDEWLQHLVSSSHSQYSSIRKALIEVIKISSQNTISNVCKNEGLLPSQVFPLQYEH